MGFGALPGCGGAVKEAASDAGASAGTGNSAGGAGNAGASSGGVGNAGASSGGTGNAGASSGGAITGGGGSIGGGPSGGSAGAGGSAGMPCASPVPVTSSVGGAGPTGGYVRCADGSIHRPSVDECWSNIDPADGPALLGPPLPDGSVNYTCRKNSDCTDKPHGHCEASQTFGLGDTPKVSCVYGCVRDSECGPGEICLCGDPVGQCVGARCASDADCSAGTPCRAGNIFSVCGPVTTQFTCGPLCVTNADCPSTSLSMICDNGNCKTSAVCGRPFIVGRAPRLGGLERRNDWGGAPSPDVTALPPDVRRTLAEHYSAIGLMEHASVAAFARFSLELLALGAPAELVRLAADALGDEIEHAKLCFGLAAAYGGVAVGPGPLDTAGALENTSLAEKLRTAFIEACLGETCAAVEAAEAAERATDPVVAAVLRRISADETRHAELGWRFAKWALERMDTATRSAALRDLSVLAGRELGSREAPAPRSEPEALLAAHGVLSSSLRAALRTATIREAVLPCLHRLSGSFSEENRSPASREAYGRDERRVASRQPH